MSIAVIQLKQNWPDTNVISISHPPSLNNHNRILTYESRTRWTLSSLTSFRMAFSTACLIPHNVWAEKFSTYYIIYVHITAKILNLNAFC